TLTNATTHFSAEPNNISRLEHTLKRQHQQLGSLRHPTALKLSTGSAFVRDHIRPATIRLPQRTPRRRTLLGTRGRSNSANNQCRSLFGLPQPNEDLLHQQLVGDINREVQRHVGSILSITAGADRLRLGEPSVTRQSVGRNMLSDKWA
ncbi:hypothetical protein MUBE_04385, partial [Mycobacterium uberis]